jgi:hypothetical protein
VVVWVDAAAGGGGEVIAQIACLSSTRVRLFSLALAPLVGLRASPIAAHRVSPAGMTRTYADAHARPAAAAARDSTSAGSRAAKGALIGGIVGAGFAFAITHTSGVTDHSEDGIVHILPIRLGIVIGVLAAAIGGVSASG